MKKESLKLSFLLVLPDSDPVAGIVRRTRWRSSVPGLFGGGNREFDDCLDLLVEFGDSLVFADGLDGVNGDHLAVELDALGGKRLGQIGGRLAMVSASA